MKRTALIVAVAALCVAGSAVAQDRSGQYFGSGGRAEDGGQMMGSGNAAGQTVGSGGFTTHDSGQVLGSGARSEDGSQIFGSGGYLGSGNRTADAGGLIGSGTRTEDGYYGGGLSVRQLRLLDGSSLLVVSWDDGMFVILIEE